MLRDFIPDNRTVELNTASIGVDILKLFYLILLLGTIQNCMPKNPYTEDPRYDNNVCYQRFCCKIEFALIKKLGMYLSKV